MELPRLILAGLLFFATSTSHLFAQGLWTQYNGPFSGQINSYATLGDTLFTASRLTGIFKSTDGGAHWRPTLPELTYAQCMLATDTSLLIGIDEIYSYNPTHGLTTLGNQNLGTVLGLHIFQGKIFCTTNTGVWEYDPATNTFLDRNEGLPRASGVTALDQLASTEDVLFCNRFTAGVYRSLDGGLQWEPMDIDWYEPRWFSFLTAYDGVIYCGNGSETYRSTDKGTTWQPIRGNLPYSASDIIVVEGQVFASVIENGIYTQDPGKSTWTKIFSHKFDTWYYDGKTFLASDQGGLYRWKEQTFVRSNWGINTSYVDDVEVFDGKVYSATQTGLHHTATNGDDWSVVPEMSEDWTFTLKKRDSRLFAGGMAGLYVTTVGSTQWMRCENLPGDVDVYDIEMTADKMYLGTSVGTWVSDDEGNHWRRLPNTLPVWDVTENVGVTDSVLMAATGSGLFKLLPDSTTWQRVDFFGDQAITSLNVVGNDIYSSYMNSYSYKSSDHGKTWMETSLPVLNHVDMLVRGDNIYASSLQKIYYSSDNGENWQYWSETGIPDIFVWCITEGDSAFYAGTYGKSIFRRPFLTDADIASDVYDIAGDVIYNIEPGTTVAEFRSNVTLSYGSSLQVESAATSGRIKKSDVIHGNDKIKIIAEDAKNIRVLKVAAADGVTGIGAPEKTTIQIYPVPAGNKLYVTSPETIVSCRITSAQGVTLLTPTLQGNVLDISSLAKGFYLLTIQDIVHQKKVIKFTKE